MVDCTTSISEKFCLSGSKDMVTHLAGPGDGEACSFPLPLLLTPLHACAQLHSFRGSCGGADIQVADV